MAPKPKKGGNNEAITPIKDARFAHVHRDPRFMRPKNKDSKVTVDPRFSSMLKSNEFSSAPKVDKYGRKLQSAGSDQQMKRFYQLQKGEIGSDNEDDDEDDEDKEDEDEDESEDEEDEDNEGVSASGSESEEDEVYDPMRGRGVISGSDSDSDIDEEAAAELDAEAEDQDQEDEEDDDDIPRGDESHRFACVNLDWDHVKSIDLFKVFSGFKPEKGAIRSVRIYPSEFGKERMEREEREGPPAAIFKKAGSNAKDSDDEESEDEEMDEKAMIKKQVEDGSEEIDNEALRQYQLDRLKYYYAVVDCDSVETAKAICEACDGAEYESSANFFDLRYIPDGMEFEDSPRDESFGAPENYKPNEFTTQVFQHSNVKLTWDEDDADRIKVTRQKFSKQDLEDMDFKAYLASSDEDSEDEDDIEATKRKYRALLAGGNKDSDDSDTDGDDDKNQEMEITFAPGLSEAASELLEAKKKREQPVKEETSIEAYRRKEKERKQRKKEARAAKNKGSDESEGDDSEDQGGEALFSDDEDERLMNDSYFAEEFAGGDMMLPGKDKKGGSDKKNNKKKDNKKRTKEERLEDNRKKAELELLMEDNRENNQHFNMKEIQKAEKKNKKKKNKGQNDKDKGEDLQDDFKIDVADPRFSALHESHHFALDPTNPNFKKTKAMTELLQERQKRTASMHDENEKKLKQKQGNNNNNNNSKKNSNNDNTPKIKVKGTFEDPSLSLLVDTVKRKSAMATEQTHNGKRPNPKQEVRGNNNNKNNNNNKRPKKN